MTQRYLLKKTTGSKTKYLGQHILHISLCNFGVPNGNYAIPSSYNLMSRSGYSICIFCY